MHYVEGALYIINLYNGHWQVAATVAEAEVAPSRKGPKLDIRPSLSEGFSLDVEWQGAPPALSAEDWKLLQEGYMSDGTPEL